MELFIHRLYMSLGLQLGPSRAARLIAVRCCGVTADGTTTGSADVPAQELGGGVLSVLYAHCVRLLHKGVHRRTY